MLARDNPFATAHIRRIRYRFAGLTWGQFMDRLALARYRGAIVGPEGSGKSTLLEDLRTKLAERGFQSWPLRLTEEEPQFPKTVLTDLTAKLNRQHIVLLDGAEQMSRWAWWRFRRRLHPAGGLIVTAHRAVRLPTVLECGTTPELLSDIIGRLLADQHAIPRAEVLELFRRHEGNVREALRELYDRYGAQGRPTGTSPTGAMACGGAGVLLLVRRCDGSTAVDVAVDRVPQRRQTVRGFLAR